jgi:hypothetical protein
MDIDTAQAAVTLLVPYLQKAGGGAATEAGKAAWKQGERALQVIRGRFKLKKNAPGEAALQRLEEEPIDEGRQAGLASILVEDMKEDPTFGQELARVVRDAAQDGQVNQFMTEIYGNAWVGKVVNIQQMNADRVSF